MEVWNGWGYAIAFFRALKSAKNRSFCGISEMFLQISASEKYFSDSGTWPFHTPPIHTPTKCRPTNGSIFTLPRGGGGLVGGLGSILLEGRAPCGGGGGGACLVGLEASSWRERVVRPRGLWGV